MLLMMCLDDTVVTVLVTVDDDPLLAMSAYRPPPGFGVDIHRTWLKYHLHTDRH